MTKTKCVYIGNLAAVAEYMFFTEELEVITILCEKERITDDLLTFSLLRNIEIKEVDKEHPIEDYINRIPIDVIFVMCSYGRRVPIEKCEGHKIFNIHYAALPNYRGRHPSYWATVNNEKRLGVTMHYVTEKFDDGNIVEQIFVPYYFWEDERDIFDKLTKQVPKLLKSLVEFLKGRDYKMKNSGGKYFAPVEKKDITVDLEKDSPSLIYNKVRSQTRAGGAIMEIDGKRYRVFGIRFSKKNVEKTCVEEEKLYIRYKDNISICLYDYKKEKD